MVITHWGSINAEKMLHELCSGCTRPVDAYENTYVWIKLAGISVW